MKRKLQQARLFEESDPKVAKLADAFLEARESLTEAHRELEVATDNLVAALVEGKRQGVRHRGKRILLQQYPPKMKLTVKEEP
jgi:hypothetical protein